MSDAKTISGKCKWFNSAKGFGFITPNDGQPDIFVHQTSIHSEGFRSLGEGEDVEYTIEIQDDGKQKAVNVTGPEGAYCVGPPRRFRKGNRRGRGGRDNADGEGEQQEQQSEPVVQEQQQ